MSIIDGGIYPAYPERVRGVGAVKSNTGVFARTFAALNRAAQSPDARTGEPGGIYHSRTIAGGSYPISEAPDYSEWDKEDAYCDIVRRYNLLNMLSKEKASGMGLGQAYQRMTDEIKNLLYGGDNFNAGAGGVLSGRAAMAGARMSGTGGAVSAFDYFNYNDTQALLQFRNKQMTEQAYLNYMKWNNLMRELYGV